ncbi:iron ABC transporter permease [Phreatobacter stygius]|uniref:Iron ABC transporter permease n=2 Tax=Phreatobacter stygius TaxID=1940610 RepID=A0A4D7BE80_9HYPH|nr:iron ABC transporter permease [Phreatobacter stygius]
MTEPAHDAARTILGGATRHGGVAVSPPPSHIALSEAGERLLTLYAAQLRKRVLIVVALLAAAVMGLFLDLTTGPSGLPFSQTWAALTGAPEAGRAAEVIVWHVRLPIAVMAILVGIALSLAGAEMQTILDNPLASPFTLGVSAAASVGAAPTIVLGLSLPYLPAGLAVAGNAFLFAFGSVLLLQALARRSEGGPYLLVLFGVGLVFAFNALLALVQFLGSAEALQELAFWTMGSLARADWTAIAILASVVAIIVPCSFAASSSLNALRLGNDRAASYGIDVARLRFLSLLRSSLLAATAVAFVGTIGFVGLVGPHIARMLIGEDHRFFLPTAALTGAVVMSFASVASKLVVTGALLPVGIVTSLVGLPVFFILIMRQRRR